MRNILTTGLIGIAASIGPVVAFNYGEKNINKLRKTLGSVVKIWLATSLSLVLIGLVIRTPLIQVFMSENSSQEFYNMSLFGITIEIFAIPFLSACFTASRLFLAVNNRKVATFLSVFRNLVFRTATLLILPAIFHVNGVWFAIPTGEFLSFIMVVIIIYLNRDNYGYGKDKIAYYIVR